MTSKVIVVDKNLPKKEKDLFNTLMSLYDRKDYTQALKNAENILSKFPNHGETQAMKGLVVHTTGSRDEAYVLIKSGLRNDVSSSLCWHVYGLIYRADDNYKEASKCFLNALRLDPSNPNILRDLSWLQIQLGDFLGFQESRRRSIVLKPALRINWVAYIAALYLNAQYDVCFNVINQLRDNWSNDISKDIYEESELLLFQNRCLEKQMKYTEALNHLDTFNLFIVDKLSLKIKTAELYLKTFNFQQSQEMWKILLNEQTSNYRFHCGYQISLLQIEDIQLIEEMLSLTKLDLPSTVLLLSTEQKDILLSHYLLNYNNKENKENKENTENKENKENTDNKENKENKENENDIMIKTFCNNSTTKRIALTLMNGELLKKYLNDYLIKKIESNVPSLCNDIITLATTLNGTRMVYLSDSNILKNHTIIHLILELVDTYITNLKLYGNYDGSIILKNTASPSGLLWALYLKSHIYEMSGNLKDSLNLMNQCIMHTPTACDFYMKKARIIKKLGDLKAASEILDFGRSLDLQDRFINNKTTKYLLRADLIYPAMKTIELFTKHDGDPQQILTDLQVSWYECELGESCERQNVFGFALKKFDSVAKHFIDYYADMFDFHAYCLRKSALRSYTDMLSMLDGLHSHKTYQRAARGSIRIYLRIAAGEHTKDINFEETCNSVSDTTDVLETCNNIENNNNDNNNDNNNNNEDNDKEDEIEDKTVNNNNLSSKKKKRKNKKKTQNQIISSNENDKIKEKEKEDDEQLKNKYIDEDPRGLKYVDFIVSDKLSTSSTALLAATKWCSNLSRHINLEPETQALVCAVYLARQKYILAMRALTCGFETYKLLPNSSITPIHPDLLVMLTNVALTIKNTTSSVSNLVKNLVEEQLNNLLNDKDIYIFIKELMTSCNNQLSLDYKVAIAKSMLLCLQQNSNLCSFNKNDAISIVTSDNYCDWSTVSCKSCINTVKELRITFGLNKSDSIFSIFINKCLERFPNCTNELGGISIPNLSIEEEFATLHKTSYGVI